ncbi:MAG: hypothetical protein ABJF11_06910 [Reichenbachiella sp.]|uniref:hypothetical protein n=1 Tax=Reichenbachiella sp. TaxID=2184521 RepID=UPI0032665BCF
MNTLEQTFGSRPNQSFLKARMLIMHLTLSWVFILVLSTISYGQDYSAMDFEANHNGTNSVRGYKQTATEKPIFFRVTTTGTDKSGYYGGFEFWNSSNFDNTTEAKRLFGLYAQNNTIQFKAGTDVVFDYNGSNLFTISSSLKVTGDLDVSEGMIVKGLLEATQGMKVTGLLEATQGLNVIGLLEATQGMNVTGDLEVNGHLKANNGMTITGDLGVSAALTANHMEAKNDMTVGGHLNVSNIMSDVDNVDFESNIKFTKNNSLSFSRGFGQRINLTEIVSSNTKSDQSTIAYGIGVQTNTQYFRSAKNFAWFKGGYHSNNEVNSGYGKIMMVLKDGKLGIGTDTPSAGLEVKGTAKVSGLATLGGGMIVGGVSEIEKIKSPEITVIPDMTPDKNNGAWPDYVFEKDYKLTPLNEVAQFVEDHHHLPEVPSAADIAAEGYSLAEMDAILLKKIEELTLHMIRLQLENENLKAQMGQ